MFVDKECLVVEFEKKVSEIENKRFQDIGEILKDRDNRLKEKE